MDKKKKIVAIVQARMGSSRLPGKVLMDIVRKPMLWHVINRLGHASLIDCMVVATSTSEKDDAIQNCCDEYNINCYRGSEEDVLDRFHKAAKVFQADVVVRITADCPLIDSHVADEVISYYLKNRGNFEGASNTINRTYPRGLDVEVVSYLLLEQIWKEAQKDYQREHVTAYVYEHPEKFKILSVENDKNLSNLRLTVDEESDLRFVREIYRRLYQEGKIFLLRDILAVLAVEPDLKEINRHTKQKAVGQ